MIVQEQNIVIWKPLAMPDCTYAQMYMVVLLIIPEMQFL